MNVEAGEDSDDDGDFGGQDQEASFQLETDNLEFEDTGDSSVVQDELDLMLKKQRTQGRLRTNQKLRTWKILFQNVWFSLFLFVYRNRYQRVQCIKLICGLNMDQDLMK